MEFLLFLIGGVIYTFIELLWDGSTHWTMFLLGGICFVIMGLLNEYKFSWKESIIKQSLISAVIITIFEFITGCIVNLIFKLDIWDYSNLPFNILGQVCLYFFILWIPLSIVGIIIDDWSRYFIYLLLKKYFPNIQKREKPKYKLIGG